MPYYPILGVFRRTRPVWRADYYAVTGFDVVDGAVVALRQICLAIIQAVFAPHRIPR